MAKARQASILEVAVSKLGVHRGALAAAKIGQLAIATQQLGHFPTAVEYGEYWAIDERTAWRHRATAHDVLGENWVSIVEELAARADRSKSPSKFVGQVVAV